MITVEVAAGLVAAAVLVTFASEWIPQCLTYIEPVPMPAFVPELHTSFLPCMRCVPCMCLSLAGLRTCVMLSMANLCAFQIGVHAHACVTQHPTSRHDDYTVCVLYLAVRGRERLIGFMRLLLCWICRNKVGPALSLGREDF